MPIKIYTYPNPYSINETNFWAEIESAPQFCVSQTMVNGMNHTYPLWKERKQLGTVTSLLNNLYEDWNSLERKMVQLRDVDNAITEIGRGLNETIYKSIVLNARAFTKCLRLFAELGLDPKAFDRAILGADQMYLLDVYQQVKDKPSFAFRSCTSRSEAAKVIEKALTKGETPPDFEKFDKDRIVIHGVHQFSPALINAVTELSQFYTVILLFNYQPKYHKVYETWLRVYSLFEVPIVIEQRGEFEPNNLLVDSYPSNVLADYIGKISGGETFDNYDPLANLEVTQFENLTEFANYVADLYQEAANEARVKKRMPLALMKEQFYSPSLKANDILRAYFPEQFGERHFLDYPFGHFFVAILSMWDPDQNKAVVENFSSVKECFNSGIIHENRPGELVESLNKILPFLEEQRDMDGIIRKIRTLVKYANTSDATRKLVGYFNVDKQDLLTLCDALKDLKEMVETFFQDYGEDPSSFKNFYIRVQRLIASKLSDPDDLDEEVLPVVRELKSKLAVSNFEGNASFTCLRNTLDFYLSQNDKAGSSAHWIVRGFEQIDGDILRSDYQQGDVCYHFACLSDKDVCASEDSRLPWPLDIAFFENNVEPLDLKYQIYLRSKLEYRNFNLYALLYGLQFNRAKLKLSYVRTDGFMENDILFVFKMLGTKIHIYEGKTNSNYVPCPSFPLEIEHPVKVDALGRVMASICPFRFALETLVQGKTLYKDRFLIHNLIKIEVVKKSLERLQGEYFNESMVEDVVDSEIKSYCTLCRLDNEFECVQLKASAYQQVSSYAFGKIKRFPRIEQTTEYLEKIDMQRTLLIKGAGLQKWCKGAMSENDVLKMVASGSFRPTPKREICVYCACKNICLEDKK